MKTFYVLWTYQANYSGLLEVPAESAEKACKQVLNFWAPDFAKKACVYVFDTKPAFVHNQKQD
jgi:hypothetical protein